MQACGFSRTEIPLDRLNPAALTPVRQVIRSYGDQDHSRWILSGRVAGIEEPVFVKLWNPTYIRRDTLPQALDAGFYQPDTTPALRGLVMSNGQCRGYVMAACHRRMHFIQRFFRLVCQRTLDTGYFAVQFSPAHALRLRGQWTMIDLEGVYPLDRLDLVSAHFSAFAYRPYAAFIARHLGVAMPPLEPHRSLSSRLWTAALRKTDIGPTTFNTELIEP